MNLTLENLSTGSVFNELEDSRRWIKTDEAVLYLSCDRATLLKLRKAGVLPWYKLGGAIYYNRFEIDRIIASNRVDVKSTNGDHN